jgi:shikimate dehydrogenase
MTDFGLIGHPVAHSMSKVMQEAAFRELGLGYTYGLFDVSEEELKLFMDNSSFRGLNVTVPLKRAVVAYMDELSPEAAVIGAVNTIESSSGRKVGHNTDASGFMKCLGEAGIGVRDQTFLVLGAGGAARGIVFKLAMEKARVYLWARDPKKAEALSADVLEGVGVHVEPTERMDEVMRKADVLVNATSAGMSPKADETPVPKELLDPLIKVVDIVYNPVETRLLREAGEKGCFTVGGLNMLVHQGAEALRIWLGVEPPVEAMRKAVSDALATRG